jgi:endonuclease YncB( thermonuclease family)
LFTTAEAVAADTLGALAFDSTASLLDSSGSLLTDDSLVAVHAADAASNTDSDGNGDATDYGSTAIPLVAVDGNVVGIGCPLVNDDADFSYDQDEFLLNVWDDQLGGSGTVLFDEGHGQFYDLSKFSAFENYAEDNGYTVESTSDLASDLSGADAVVITSPADGFSDSLKSSLSSFVSNGGSVFLHSQSDYSDYDQTANLNGITAALGVGFQFNDDQVEDGTNNTGASFVPTTTNFNTAQFGAFFQSRSGIDEANALDPSATYTVDITEVTDGDTVNVEFSDGRTEEIRVLGVDTPEKRAAAGAERPAEWEGLADPTGLSKVQFGSTGCLLNESNQPLTDDSIAAVYAESTASVTDADSNGDAVSYPDDTPIPLLAIDGTVVGVGSTLVDDNALQYNANLDNEELLLNVWDDQLGGSGTVLWDETHNDFDKLSSFSTFESYAEDNGYTVDATADLTADLSGADAVVIPPVVESYTSAELDALSNFVSNGGSVFLHNKADYQDHDATAELNTVAATLGASFRFDDAQVVDDTNNTGASHRPTTTRFDPGFAVFAERRGVDQELLVTKEGSAVSTLEFTEGASSLLNASKQPLSDSSIVAVWAESSASVGDGDGNGDAVTYPDGTDIPLVSIDGQVAGFGTPLVTDSQSADADNEEFLLNVWDQLLGGSGTVRWDESHGQFFGTDKVSNFAEYAGKNGYTVEAGSAIPSDTSNVDGLVITSPGSFSDSELSNLSSFVSAGGAVFLHDQDDYSDYDQTANLNAIAAELGVGFRFNDAQVTDDSNNLGQSFKPKTTNFNTTDFPALFEKRAGMDEVENYWNAAHPYLAYWGQQATEFAQSELSGKTVDLTFDQTGAQFNGGVRDPFGRLLAYITYDAGSGSRDTLYNQKLVEQGYARSYGSSLGKLEQFLGAELSARDSGKGLWHQSNPDLSPTIRNGEYSDVFVPKATAVERSSGSLDSSRVPISAAGSASPSNAALVGVDTANNLAVVGGYLIDEDYEQAEGFDADTSNYGNFAFLTSLVDSLSADGTSGPILIEGGHGQFNAGYGLSSEDTAYYQRYLEGVDIGFEGINDLTASRLDDARAVLISTPTAALTTAELSALSTFVSNGGAVVLLGDATATSSARSNLNHVAAELGSDLRLSSTAVTDSSANLNGDSSLVVTDQLATDQFDIFGPYDSESKGTPTLSVTFPNGAKATDGTVTAAIELSHAPKGLAGYNLSASVGDTNVATITSASYSVLGTTQTPDVASDGSSVQLKASDTGGAVEAGATNVELARIELEPGTAGSTTLSLSVSAFDADDGSAISPDTVSGVLESRGVESVNGEKLPTDPDGDGLYEDVDGDGDTDEDDVVLLFEQKESDAVTDNVEAYDFNGNGRIDFDDINELYDEIVGN